MRSRTYITMLQIKYADTSKADAPLADTDEIYFVYYQQKTLPIGYELVNSDGSFTQRHADTATGSLGEYSMPAGITAPLTLGGYNNNGSTYYAYALGTESAANVTGMQIITTTTNSQNNGRRPNLQIRNTWRGYEYSLDGASWTGCGYDSLQLYVLYFESQPTIVTLTEKTIGTAEDMKEAFEYTVTLTETVTSYNRTDRYKRSGKSGRYTYTLISQGTPEQNENRSSETVSHVNLKNGDRQSYSIVYIQSPDNLERDYYSSGSNYCRDYSFTVTTQTITIVQSHKSGFEN